MPTLAALVAGSAAGIVREVVIADGGSKDDTEKIADAAGCNFVSGPADPGARLRAAAHDARGNWLLFLDPASVLDEGWTREVRAFTDSADRSGLAERRAATFRLRKEGFGMAPLSGRGRGRDPARADRPPAGGAGAADRQALLSGARRPR